MNKKREILLLVFLIILFFVINYKFLNNAVIGFLEERETGIVERIIDGDTVVINNESVRLLGINSPERGELYYEEAKEFLEMIILNKNVELKFGKEKYDKYKRKLAYLFYKGKNVNLELVDEGYANFYFPSGKDEYYDRFVRNWEHCTSNNKYLCEKSEDKCADCIGLKEFNYKNQKVIFYNKCDFDCDLEGWVIKDEGRKKFIFENFILNPGSEVGITAEDFNEDYVWTSTGDTLFLRDEEGKLVLWENY